jgi:malonyl-CoA O-methyltransferase
MQPGDFELDKAAIRRAFDRAADRYDAAAFLQREIGDRTLAHLDPIRVTPRRVLDLGSGTGYAVPHLRARFPAAEVLAADLAPNMARKARALHQKQAPSAHFICADADQLPLAAGSVDLIFCNLMLQWTPVLDRTLAECRRVLAPEGLLLFSTFGPDTLLELRRAFAAIDNEVHVHLFADMHDLGDLLIGSGFGSPVLETETLTVQYEQLDRLLRDLKTLGATNAARGRRRGLFGRSGLQRLRGGYECYRRNGKLPATYEIVYAHSWVPAADGRRQDGSTVATFPLSALRRR